ncbi:glucosyltransferase [Balamuthia mandrillaris]
MEQANMKRKKSSSLSSSSLRDVSASKTAAEQNGMPGSSVQSCSYSHFFSSSALMWYLFGLMIPVHAFVLHLVNQNVPQMYMDEVFHVPQTQRYCKHDFTQWDPMITTFPGLYAVFYLIFEFVSQTSSFLLPASSSSFDLFCQTPFMRALNVCFGLATLLLYYHLLRALQPSFNHQQRTIRALVLHLFPVQFFFHFMYYTDAASTFFVLLCYLLLVRTRKPFLAGLAGAAAVTCRQTNIVWVAFIAATCVLQRFERSIAQNSSELSFFNTLFQFLKYVLANFLNLLARLWVFVILAFSFVIFVVWNGGIVIGDRSQHQPQLHLVQVFYFAAFCSAFLLPEVISYLWRKWTLEGFKSRSCTNTSCNANLLRFALFIVLLLAAFYIVHNFTKVHPYLLADNRHYPFYVWKNFFKRHVALRYLYVPIYLLGIYFISSLLSQSGRSVLWQFMFWGCTCMVLIPAHLLEFRYFITPFLILQLNLNPSSPPSSSFTKPTTRQKANTNATCFYLINLSELFIHTSINLLTIYVFVFVPYVWGDGSIARWMW